MRRRAVVLTLLLGAAALSAGCSKKEHSLPAAPESQLPTAGPGTMVAHVGGHAWESSFTDAFLQGSPGYQSLVVSGMGTYGSNQLLVMMILPPRVSAGATYTLGDDFFGTGACFVATPHGPGPVYTTDAAHTGSITFTHVDAPHLAGTFHFDAIGDSGAVHVADGAFDMTIQAGSTATAPARMRAASLAAALRLRR